MPFFTPGGYKRSIPPGIAGISGTIVVPSLKPFDMLQDRDLDGVMYFDRRLLDPQIYLAEIDANTCSDRCTKLATYGWFDIGELDTERTSGHRGMQKWLRKSKNVIGDHWSGKLPVGDDQRSSIEVCLGTQLALGCESLILPGPLTSEPGSNLAKEIKWLREGLAIGRSVSDLPLIATVAISDVCLRETDPFDNGLIDALLDEVSAREPDGVYLVLELFTESGYYCTSKNTVGSMLRLVDGFKQAGIQRVVVNYWTVAGLMALALGADTWCTGYYLSERKLSRAECADKTAMAFAYPAFYSHALAGEIHLKGDMDQLVDEGLLEAVADVTPYSEGLIRGLRKGFTVADVPDWAHSRNNVTYAKGHFSSAMARETITVDKLAPRDKLRYVEDWLEGATQLATKLLALDDVAPRTELTHQRSWRRAFATHLDKR
jgi:hypothetical protein